MTELQFAIQNAKIAYKGAKIYQIGYFIINLPIGLEPS